MGVLRGEIISDIRRFLEFSTPQRRKSHLLVNAQPRLHSSHFVCLDLGLGLAAAKGRHRRIARTLLLETDIDVSANSNISEVQHSLSTIPVEGDSVIVLGIGSQPARTETVVKCLQGALEQRKTSTDDCSVCLDGGPDGRFKSPQSLIHAFRGCLQCGATRNRCA